MTTVICVLQVCKHCTEELSHQCEATEPASGRAGIETQATWLRKPCSSSFYSQLPVVTLSQQNPHMWG